MIALRVATEAARIASATADYSLAMASTLPATTISAAFSAPVRSDTPLLRINKTRHSNEHGDMTSLVPLLTMSVSALFRETATAGIVSRDVPALGAALRVPVHKRVAGRRSHSRHSIDANGGICRCMPCLAEAAAYRLAVPSARRRGVDLDAVYRTANCVACRAPESAHSGADHHATSGA